MSESLPWWLPTVEAGLERGLTVTITMERLGMTRQAHARWLSRSAVYRRRVRAARLRYEERQGEECTRAVVELSRVVATE